MLKVKNYLKTIFLFCSFLFFLNGCSHTSELDNISRVTDNENAEVFTTDISEVPEYIIDADDILSITVYKRSDLQTIIDLPSIIVEPNGYIAVPLIGDIQAKGRTRSELRDIVHQEFSKFLIAPVVHIIVIQKSGQVVYILGEVKKPGNYPVLSKTTAIEAILTAGGFTNDADLSNILVLRTFPKKEQSPQKKYLTALDIKNLLEKADVRQNVVLKKGDILFVPPDHIAQTNRYFKYIRTLIAPFVDTVGMVANIVILSGSTDW